MAPRSDHVLEVGVELIPRRQDVGPVVDDVPFEELLDVIAPNREQLPVLAGSAQQRADDRRRVSTGDVGDEVAAPNAGDRLDQFGDDLDDQRLQPRGATGRECLGDQSAQPVVRLAVEAQDVVDGAVPQRSGGDALRVKPSPCAVAKRSSRSTVRTSS